MSSDNQFADPSRGNFWDVAATNPSASTPTAPLVGVGGPAGPPTVLRSGGYTYVVAVTLVLLSLVPFGFAVLIATAPHGTVRPAILLGPLGLFMAYTGITAFRARVVIDGDVIRWTGFFSDHSVQRSHVATFNTQIVRGRGGPQLTVRMTFVNGRTARLPLFWQATSAGKARAEQNRAILEAWRAGI